jgi:FtsP/CotA-like multicopper oxidase with cupredoxin domain
LRHKPSTRFLSRRSLLIGCGSALTTAAVVPGSGADTTRTGMSAQPDKGAPVLEACVARVPLRGPGAAPTPVWCYGGSLPGPVLRVKRGEDVRRKLANALPQPTAMIWHGIRATEVSGTAAMTQPSAPGETLEYGFRAADAGTFWYHARDRGALAQGLYGALIVEEQVPVEADRDVLLMLDEWRLGRDGAIAADQRVDHDPTLHVTANGRPMLDIPVKANERVRLRLINAAMDRGFLLRTDRHRAIVMAIDGAPTEPFEAQHGRVILGPGNRLDLFVDMTLTAGDSAPILVEQPTGEAPLARFIYDPGSQARLVRRPEPQPLPPNPLPLRMAFEHALRVDIELEGEPTARAGPWTITALAPAPLFSVRLGRTVMLNLVNRGDVAHAVHVHGHHFRVLDNLDDGWKPFWLDTVTVPGQQALRVAFVADNPGAWPIERRLLAPMRPTFAAWFEVTEGHPSLGRSLAP